MDNHLMNKTRTNNNTLFEEDNNNTLNIITSSSTTTMHHQQQQSPPRISFKSHPPPQIISYDNLLYSPSRSSTTTTTTTTPLPPPSPDSPWTLSPHHTPSPSLLHHCIASLHRHDGAIHSIAAAKGLVFTGSDSSRVRAWRQPDCTERGCFKSTSGDVRAILAKGNTLFTSHKDRKVRVWSIAAAAPDNFHAKKTSHLPKTRPFFIRNNNNNKHKDHISCMAYNHAEGLLYTGSHDRTVKVWRVSDSKCVDSITAHEDQVNAVVVNQDDGCLFTCSSDGSVKIWRRVYGQSSHTLTMTLKLQPSPVNALAITSSPPSPANNTCFLYSGSSDGFINFWEKEKMSGRYNHGGFLQGHRFAVLCLVAIEKLLFSGSEDTTIRVWRREENSCFHECLAVLDAHRGPVKCLAATLEIEKVVVMGFLVYSSGLDQTFKVWRIKVLAEEKEGQNGNYTTDRRRNYDHHRRRGDVEAIDINQVKVAEYEMSPVLSPSWVEKKLQGDHNHNPFH